MLAVHRYIHIFVFVFAGPQLQLQLLPLSPNATIKRLFVLEVPQGAAVFIYILSEISHHKFSWHVAIQFRGIIRFALAKSGDQKQRCFKSVSGQVVLCVQTKLERHGCRLLPKEEGGEQAVLGWALKQPSVSVAPLALPLLTCLSLCHCNWHSNHNNCSPLWGVGTWTGGDCIQNEYRGEKGNRQAQIMLALHCKWMRLWMLRAGTRVGLCSDVYSDKGLRIGLRRWYGDAVYLWGPAERLLSPETLAFSSILQQILPVDNRLNMWWFLVFNWLLRSRQKSLNLALYISYHTRQSRQWLLSQKQI